MDKITFLVWDQGGSSFAPRRMGKATLTPVSEDDGVTYQAWLLLDSILPGDTAGGSLNVEYSETAGGTPTYELALLAFGVFLTTISLCWGFYVWRAEKMVMPTTSNNYNNVHPTEFELQRMQRV
jgi:hypothetical protein